MPMAGLQSSLCPACLLELGVDHDTEAPAANWMRIAMTGQRLGDYELLQELGRGGMGIVYRARQISLDREVAVKVLPPHLFSVPEAVDRFRVEAQAAASLHHPGIVAIHEFGCIQGCWFLAMELVEGRSLAALVDDQALSPRQAARYLLDIAEAVQHAHSCGVLHRDLKPSNILVDSYDQVHLTDFGLAKQLKRADGLTLTGELLGSPNYLSPEQAEGRLQEIDERSDVYALGAVLYQLLTTRPPFAADSLTGTLTQVMQRDPVRPRLLIAEIPLDLETICLKCLEKERSARYASAQEVADDLSRFLKHQPIHARPANWFERVCRWSRRNPGLAFVGGVALTLLLILLIGAPLATLKVAQEARRAVEEGRRLQATIRRMELHHAQDAFENQRSAEALAILARLVRENPADQVAALRLVNALSRRSYPLPSSPPLRHTRAVQGAWFTPDGLGVVSVARNNAAFLWDPHHPEAPLRTFPHDPKPADPVRYLSSVSPIVAVLSPDGTRLATASIDTTARVWNLKTGQPLTPALPHPDWVTGISFSPDGQTVATACKDGAARLWSIASGELKGAPMVHGTWVNFVVFSPDGTRLLTGADGGTAKIWDSATGRLIAELSGHTSDVKSGAFSPDGRRVLTASSDHSARLWDATSGAMIGKPMRHGDIVVQARFSPDGLLVATASFDHTARIWDGYSGDPISPPLRHEGTVRWVEFSPEGERLATASKDATAVIWDVRTGETLTEPIRHDNVVWSAVFSPDAQFLVTSSADRTVQIWDVRDGRALPLVLPLTAGVQSAAWSPDGAQVALAGKFVALFDSDSGTPQITERRFQLDKANVLKFDPEGQRLAIGSADGTIELRGTREGTRLVPVMRQDGEILDVAFSPDGGRLASASSSGTVVLWEPNTGSRQGSAPLHQGPVLSLQFSPDGRLLLTASTDGLARLVTVPELETRFVLRGHQLGLAAAEFSPDGRRIVTASKDFTARLWDAATGRALGDPIRHRAPLTFVHFSPDGEKVLTGCADGTAGIWSSADGKLLTPLLRQAGTLADGGFSSDGRFIVTAAVNGVARLWDPTSGQMLDNLSKHSQRLTAARFDPGNRWLLTASRDRSAWITRLQVLPERFPEWLPLLAESVAGQRLDDERAFHQVTTEEVLEVRAKLEQIEGNRPMRTWLRWFFADRWKRPISPESRVGFGEYIERQKGTCLQALPRNIQKLRRLMRMAPNNGSLAATLAAAELQLTPSPEPGCLARAQWLIRRAAKLAPGCPEVERAKALLKQRIGSPSRQRRANEG